MDSPVINDHYSLNNLTNYKTNIDISSKSIIHKYNYLITEYLSFIFEDEYITSLKTFPIILNKGICTISDVFRLTLYYTQNIDMAYFHGQKAYYLYLEFITQTNETHNVFLKLTTMDACMFVYKKTIFDVKVDIRVGTILSPDDTIKMNILTKQICYMKKIINLYIHLLKSKLYNDKELTKCVITQTKNITTIISKLNKVNTHIMILLSNYTIILNKYIKTLVTKNMKNTEIIEYYEFYNNKIELLIDFINICEPDTLVKIDNTIKHNIDSSIFENVNSDIITLINQ